jgi:hypothetical protein
VQKNSKQGISKLDSMGVNWQLIKLKKRRNLPVGVKVIKIWD